ncbi:FAD-binding protein, partial [bacterium]|nr:FAD-binding protein [bacterium]
IRIDPVTNNLCRTGVKSIINPLDIYAIEEAVRLKEKHGGSVTVISMGPPQAQDAIREAIARGADEGFLLCDKTFAGADTLATSFTLAMAIRYLGGADLIFCGKQAIDGDTAQVGPGIAEFLKIPCLCYVKNILSVDKKNICIESMTDLGYDIFSATLPVVLTVVKELNTPRLTSFPAWINAKRKKINTLDRKTLGLKKENTGLKGSPTMVKKITPVNFKKKTTFMKGSSNDIAAELYKIITSPDTSTRLVQTNERINKKVYNKFNKNILIIGALVDSKITGSTLELISEANKLVEGNKSKISVVFIEKKINIIKLDSEKLNVDIIYYIEGSTFECPDTDVFSSAIQKLVLKNPFDIILGSATPFGRAMLPRLAVKLKTGLTADCTILKIDPETGEFLQTRPAFGGNILATIICKDLKPEMATVRPHVFEKTFSKTTTKRAKILHFIPDNISHGKITLLSVHKNSGKSFNISDSRIIIAGGKGIGEKGSFLKLEELAELLDGAVGASRGAVDAGWIDYARQIGQTGKTLQPDIYIAFGISGAVQHLVGMQASGTVIAINSDPAADIFKISDYGIVSDYEIIIDALIKLIKEKNSPYYEEKRQNSKDRRGQK